MVNLDDFRFYRRLSKWARRILIFAQGVTSLEGPVEKIDGRFTLRIPLALGGSRLTSSARGISRVEDGYLIIVIQDWLAEKLNITEGCRVSVDNRNGELNIFGPPWDNDHAA